MHKRDQENWQAMHDGDRPATWADFIGDPAGASYLTRNGVMLMPRIADDLSTWFGPHWLSTAIGPNGGGQIPWLRRFSPTLTINGDIGAAGAFLEIVRWWAALGTQAAMPGMRTVRKDLRSDITLSRLLHTLTQTRVGALATTDGMQVIYEPQPGDLLIDDGRTQLTVEVFAMRTSRDLEEQTETSQEMFNLLDDLALQYGVQFRGQLPPIDTDLLAWREHLNNIAQSAARLGIPLSAHWDGEELVVEPGDLPEGANIDGPTIQTDVGSRLSKHARSKARQVSTAGAAWLWLENHGAIDLLTPIHSSELPDQLTAYTGLFQDAFTDAPNIQGLTFSGAGRRTRPLPPVQRATAGFTRGLTQPLPGDRVRTTIHIPQADDQESALMWRLVEHEHAWLDIALATLGVPCLASELVTNLS